MPLQAGRGIYRAAWIGSRAQSLLTRPGFSGEVISVCSDVAYIAAKDDEIFWLAGDKAPLHWRGIHVAFPTEQLRAGDKCRLSDQGLTLGGQVTLDLHRAKVWSPGRLASRPGLDPGRLNESVRRFLRTVSTAIEKKGPEPPYDTLTAIMTGAEAKILSHDGWQGRMLAPLGSLIEHCLEQGVAEIKTKGRELVGLGAGLTPWGDDFLGGLFFALHNLREVYPEAGRDYTEEIAELIRWASGRTHPVSFTIMADLARGCGPEPLHDLLSYLFSGEDQPAKEALILRRLFEVGGSTGRFILVGMLTGLLAFCLKYQPGLHGVSE